MTALYSAGLGKRMGSRGLACALEGSNWEIDREGAPFPEGAGDGDPA